MQTQVRTSAGIAKIVLQGRFDFGSHRDFKTSYEAPLGAADVRGRASEEVMGWRPAETE